MAHALLCLGTDQPVSKDEQNDSVCVKVSKIQRRRQWHVNIRDDGNDT
jgi:hypothetical protein